MAGPRVVPFVLASSTRVQSPVLALSHVHQCPIELVVVRRTPVQARRRPAPRCGLALLLLACEVDLEQPSQNHDSLGTDCQPPQLCHHARRFGGGVWAMRREVGAW